MPANPPKALIFKMEPGYKSTKALSYNCALGLTGMRPHLVRLGRKNSNAFTL